MQTKDISTNKIYFWKSLSTILRQAQNGISACVLKTFSVALTLPLSAPFHHTTSSFTICHLPSARRSAIITALHLKRCKNGSPYLQPINWGVPSMATPPQCPCGVLAPRVHFRGSPVPNTLPPWHTAPRAPHQRVTRAHYTIPAPHGPLAYRGRLARCPGYPLSDTHHSYDI